MNRAFFVAIAVALTSTIFAGCIGEDGDNLNAAIPRAVVTVSEVAGKIDTFMFDASASTGRGLGFAWTFGDGDSSNEAAIEHTYLYGAGFYDVKLTVTDTAGITDIWTDRVQVGDGINLAPQAFFKPSTRYLAVGEALTVDAKLTEDPEGDPVLFEWDFNFVMTESEYLDFRAIKAKTDYDSLPASDSGVTAAQDDGSADGNATGASVPAAPTSEVTALANLGNKSPGHEHGGSAPAVSLFNGFRTTTDPVFTLEEGFPDATRFYIKLTVIDVKGAMTDILSEEVWPVQVVETKAPMYYDGSMSGTFTLGGPATVTQSTPETTDFGAVYDDESFYQFEIPSAIKLMYVNVTWSQNPAAAALANDIDIELESPNAKTRSATGTGSDSIVIELTEIDEMGAGKWYIDLFARQGANIEWTISHWAKVDLNPFRDLESEWVEIERPAEEL